MLPKEHGAWTALLISLFAGWVILGQWDSAAFAASFIWLSGFILRAPMRTYRQYREADPAKAQKALAFFLCLLLTLIFSGFVFWEKAPEIDLRLLLALGIPLGLCLSVLAVWKRNLRFLWVEVLGFAGLCLLVPTLYLTRPSANPHKALLLYVLFGGYFILALFYVKVRQKWLAESRASKIISKEDRSWDGRGVLLSHVGFVVLILAASGPARGLSLGPLYALARVWAGLKWGKGNLPIMKLGIQEMIHSLVYMFMTLFAWKIF